MKFFTTSVFILDKALYRVQNLPRDRVSVFDRAAAPLLEKIAQWGSSETDRLLALSRTQSIPTIDQFDECQHVFGMRGHKKPHVKASPGDGTEILPLTVLYLANKLSESTRNRPFPDQELTDKIDLMVKWEEDRAKQDEQETVQVPGKNAAKNRKAKETKKAAKLARCEAVSEKDAEVSGEV